MLLNRSMHEILEVVKGVASPDPSFFDPAFKFERITSLERAGERDLAVLLDPDEDAIFKPVDHERIKNCKAAAILASKPIIEGKPYILAPDVLGAFKKLSFLAAGKLGAPEIHPSASIALTAQLGRGVEIGAQAVLEPGAVIGDGASIGARCYIGKDVQIGAGVVLHSGAIVHDRCIIGDGSVLYSGAVIGSQGFGYRITKRGLVHIPHIGIVRLGRMVEVGANATIDRAVFEETSLGDGVKIGSLVHIAHNVQIGAGSAILAMTTLAGSVKVGAGCFISGHCVISDHVTIGNRVRIVGKTGVMKDIPDGSVIAGVPSMPFREWKRLVALQANAGQIQKALATLEARKSFWQKLKFW